VSVDDSALVVSTMSTSIEDKDLPIRCFIKLAPHTKKSGGDDDKLLYYNKVLNSDMVFVSIVEKNSHGSVSNALRVILEGVCGNCFLPKVCNRAFEENTVTTMAVELSYGNGYKTFVKRREPIPRSTKRIGVFLCIGNNTNDTTTNLAAMTPTDDLYSYLSNEYRTRKNDDNPPTLYISTGRPIFIHPKESSRESSIELQFPAVRKCGFWTDATYDGNRNDDPNQSYLTPIKRSTTPRNRTKKILPESTNNKTEKSSSEEIKKTENEKEKRSGSSDSSSSEPSSDEDEGTTKEENDDEMSTGSKEEEEQSNNITNNHQPDDEEITEPESGRSSPASVNHTQDTDDDDDNNSNEEENKSTDDGGESSSTDEEEETQHNNSSQRAHKKSRNQ